MKAEKKPVLFLIVLALFVSSGAVGLKTMNECKNSDLIDGEKMHCYHVAGMTAAFLGDKSQAITICKDLWGDFGASIAQDGSNLRAKADLMANTCFYDVAKILKDPSVCDLMTEHDNFDIKLFGNEVSQEVCKEQAKRLQEIKPENYYKNPNNICSIVFIFPAILISAFYYSRDKE